MVRYYSTMAEAFFDSLEEAVEVEKDLLAKKEKREEAFEELITTIKDISQLTAEIEQEQTAKMDEAREEIRTACETYSKVYRCARGGIVLVERTTWNGYVYPLNNIKAAIVDGEKIKADTWYTLRNGEFVEA